VYKLGVTILTILLSFHLTAQFHPPVGSIGTSAMHKDSSAFVGWAGQCIIQRGELDISNPPLGYSSVGDNLSAIGQAGLNGVVSLGDAGTATLTFEATIFDGSGWDFAVFENSFNSTFLELAFVEVSSNGIDFFRFPAVSNTQDTSQIDNAGSVDATKINNLAGKYSSLYGTPFDLADLSTSPLLDIDNISHIKIIDVVGSINTSYATYDVNGSKVNDPWPTPFPSSGFDLDAVGVIHLNPLNVEGQNSLITEFIVYPNPLTSNSVLSFELLKPRFCSVHIIDVLGNKVFNFNEFLEQGSHNIQLSNVLFNKGIYYLSFSYDGNQMRSISIVKL
jgi:hypothetical protein